tara:strand:- start:1545 stop:2249 length:705 start_codon:yes stop_codon:yes gene_type:complete
MTYQLIGVGNNAKTIKGDGSEYMTAIKYMKPFKTMFKGKVHNICAMAETAKCHEGCLVSAGRGQMSSVQRGRERKTLWYLSDRVGFMDALHNDISTFRRRQVKNDISPCVRLNGTSDIMYEKSGIMDYFFDVQFYDYTKIVKRAYADLPPNYHLTLSYSEADEEYAEEVLMAVADTGVNAAVVFRDRLPDTFKGFRVIDGDKDDLRFLDPKGVVVGLKAKGKAKQDTSGFVIDC